MAPKSKKRAKPGASTPPTFEPLPLVNLSDQQDCKALQLPLELLMEILSYFKGIRRPSSNAYIHNTSNNLSEYLERTDTTRALSQTCRYWRFTLMPVLWESLDVCATHSKSKAWYQVFGETLVRKSTLMTANPEIASHVRSVLRAYFLVGAKPQIVDFISIICLSRTVNVILTRYSAATVLPAFVQGLEALPNFKVLCIASAHQKMTTALKDAFEEHTFPQVESIFLPPYCHNILRSCPSVRKVTCNDAEDASKLISAIAKECKHVEEVDGFSFQEEQTVKRRFFFFFNLVHLRSYSNAIINRIGQGNSKSSFIEIPSSYCRGRTVFTYPKSSMPNFDSKLLENPRAISCVQESLAHYDAIYQEELRRGSRFSS